MFYFWKWLPKSLCECTMYIFVRATDDELILLTRESHTEKNTKGISDDSFLFGSIPPFRPAKMNKSRNEYGLQSIYFGSSVLWRINGSNVMGKTHNSGWTNFKRKKEEKNDIKKRAKMYNTDTWRCSLKLKIGRALIQLADFIYLLHLLDVM